MCCLYILEVNSLPIASFANTFYHSEGCTFVLFLVSFAVQKLLHLIKSPYPTYILRGRIMDIVHTYVPRPIRDRGIAAALVEAAYNYAREENLTCQATCPYARTWLNENR